MVFTDVDIISQTLKEMGTTTIASLSEVTVQAETMNIIYPPTLEDILTETNWSFATVTTSDQSPLVAAPNDQKWAFKFTYPSDMLQLIGVLNSGGTDISYIPEENEVLTNQNIIRFKYILKPDESKFPPYFIRYLKSSLKYWTQEELRSSNTLANQYVEEMERTRLKAFRADAKRRGKRKATRVGNYSLVRIS